MGPCQATASLWLKLRRCMSSHLFRLFTLAQRNLRKPSVTLTQLTGPAANGRLTDFPFLTRNPAYYFGMRKFAILIAVVVALSATGRGSTHFVLRPTGPLPAVNVP
jgi:hypothetical protein